MKRVDFEQKILLPRLERIRETLTLKGNEYTADDEQFHNFIEAAKINGTTVQEALWGMASKHLVSLLDIIHNRKEATPEIVDEKIGDLTNYLILLEGVFDDDEIQGIQ